MEISNDVVLTAEQRLSAARDTLTLTETETLRLQKLIVSQNYQLEQVNLAIIEANNIIANLTKQKDNLTVLLNTEQNKYNELTEKNKNLELEIKEKTKKQEEIDKNNAKIQEELIKKENEIKAENDILSTKKAKFSIEKELFDNKVIKLKSVISEI